MLLILASLTHTLGLYFFILLNRAMLLLIINFWKLYPQTGAELFYKSKEIENEPF